MRSKSDDPRQQRLEPTLGAESKRSLADQLRLEELPNEAGEDMRPAAPDRRRARARNHWMAYAVGVIASVGVVAAGVRYLPALSGQISRGVHALIDDAVRARASIEARSPQAARPTEAERKAREAARKEAAWKDFFHRSPGCVIEANQTRVECVNEVIRARRKFDQRWGAGQL